MSKFKKGESGNLKGRPPGIKDRRTLFAELIDDHKKALLSKAVEMALDGNEQMLRLLLDRLLPARPKDDVILDIATLEGALTEQGKNVMRLITDGVITPMEGNSLLQAVLMRAKLIEITELSERLSAIEQTLNQRGK